VISEKRLMDIRQHTKVASHIPGRLRLKFSAGIFLKFGDEDISDFQSKLDALPGVTNYRANLAAFSVVLEYDQKIMPYKLFDQLFQDNEQYAIEALNEIRERFDQA